MTALTIGILGIIVFLILIFLGMNIGLALLVVGFGGYALIVSPKAAMALLRTDPATQASTYSFMVVPLFILMGNFAYHAGNPIDLVAGAVCNTGKTWDTMMLQAAGISAITGVPYDQSESAPALYPVDRPTEPETQPTETTEEVYHWFWQQPEEAVEAVQEQPEEKRNDLMIVFGGIGLGLLYILIPKKPRKKRKKPEFKWED